MPFPVRGADLIYARLVLAHLADVRTTVGSGRRNSAPGLLVLDEVERIDTDNEVFRDYLGVVTGMIASRGADMYAGARLGNLDTSRRHHRRPQCRWSPSAVDRSRGRDVRSEPLGVARRSVGHGQPRRSRVRVARAAAHARVVDADRRDRVGLAPRRVVTSLTPAAIVAGGEQGASGPRQGQSPSDTSARIVGS